MSPPRLRSRSAGTSPRVVRQVASWCLCYPDEALVARLPDLSAALAEQETGPAILALQGFLDHAGMQPLEEWQRHYVDVFDLNRRRSLYLSYWTDGDTRRRGEVLATFKQHYRDSGFLVDTHGELPDFLPMVLEYAAVADPKRGEELLVEYRPAVELLRFALLDIDTRYADVLEAVCATLPGPAPTDRAEVRAMAQSGPPTEFVGLEPYDPRLLPLQPVGPSTGPAGR